MTHFKDKVALITGGASGIGRALCQELGERGAIVIVADINLEGAQQVASVIEEKGGKSLAIKVDVTQVDEMQKSVNKVITQYGARGQRIVYTLRTAHRLHLDILFGQLVSDIWYLM